MTNALVPLDFGFSHLWELCPASLKVKCVVDGRIGASDCVEDVQALLWVHRREFCVRPWEQAPRPSVHVLNL